VTERAVFETILAATAGKTLLLLTHRLSLLRHMDRIVMLNAGRIVE
jgi:ABC-type transport system involved in cytochrome bd biosynthesis fused ATPase/permease subunit